MPNKYRVGDILICKTATPNWCIFEKDDEIEIIETPGKSSTYEALSIKNSSRKTHICTEDFLDNYFTLKFSKEKYFGIRCGCCTRLVSFGNGIVCGANYYCGEECFKIQNPKRELKLPKDLKNVVAFDSAKPDSDKTSFWFFNKKSNKNLDVKTTMEEAAKTFAERQAVYGDNYSLAAEALKGFFPNGLDLKTTEDHERFHIFMLIIVKLSRYANNWKKPHQDSIHDAGIYSFMLESIDKKQQNKEKNG